MSNRCDRRKILFIHCSKCAGKSVEHAVFGFPRMGKSEHKSVRCFPDSVLREFFVFTIIRNPWDRYLSALHDFATRLQPHRYSMENLKQHLEADLRKQSLLHASAGVRTDVAPLTIGTGWGMRPYEELLTDLDGNMRCDVVMRLERLQDDWRAVADIVGVQTLPRLNNGSQKLSRAQAYDSEARDMLAQLYELDIARFGYTFA